MQDKDFFIINEVKPSNYFVNIEFKPSKNQINKWIKGHL